MADTVDGNDSQSDAELVALARADPTAFALLYRRYLTPVYRYCYRRLGRREAAEDATSRTFTQALDALPGYRPGSFRAWLFKIAHNVVIDELRCRPTANLESALEIADDDPPLDDSIIGREAAGSVRDLLLRLGPEQRRVIELRLAGMSAAEIADVLGKTRNAVEMAQYRALVRLREMLQVGHGKEAARNGRTG